MGIDDPLTEARLARRSAGVSKLDPTVQVAGPVDRRWKLQRNVDLSARGDDW